MEKYSITDPVYNHILITARQKLDCQHLPMSGLSQGEENIFFVVYYEFPVL